MSRLSSYRVRSALAAAIVTALALTRAVGAQQPAALPDTSAKMPFDTAVTIGTLPNGLRYYVRTAQRPEKRAELRLAVNVGSILEADDQRGLAHFVEHMAFNSTTHFPKAELVHYLQSIGMRFGADLNAYTTFDETVYMLTVPTDTGDFLDKGVEILGDWATGQLFDSAEVEAERGVVIEEWRLGRGAGSRMLNTQLPVIFRGSRYADRLPIGDAGYLRTFPQAALRRFYHDWYRPDLMAVIAVGDFDKARVIQLITDRFGRIPRPSAPLARPAYPVPPHESTYVAIATDRETPNSSVVVYTMRPPHDQSTIGAYRQSMVEDLYDGMLNRRFGEIVQKPDPPFVGAQSGEGLLVRASEISVLAAGVQDGGILRGLDAILTEKERVARYGFTATEFEREKTNLLRQYEELNAEADKRSSASHASELTRNFLDGESIPGGAREYALHQRFLPTITLDEVNRLARTAPGSGSVVVLVGAPDKAGVTVPTEAQILAAFDSVKRTTIAPYTDVVASAPLLATPPAPGTITRTKQIPAIGVTEWKLSNGVTVVLKPTDFQADQILLSGRSPGGSSLAPDSTYLSADFATQVVTAGGAGAFSAVDLGKELTGKVANATPFISARSEGVRGSASKKDLETMFQLVWLRFTAPRRDSMAFVAWRERLEAQLQNRAAVPAVAFFDTLTVTLSQHAFRERPLTSAMVGEVNLDRALAFYRDRFADAGDFTFVLVGNFDVDSIRPLVERYLGGLPAIHRREAGRDRGIRPPKGVVERTVKRGVEPQSQSMIVFTGPFDWTRRNNYTLQALRDLLQQRLTDRLREAMGGTYSVNVFANTDRDTPTDYDAGVQFGSAPERADELSKAVFAEIQSLRDSGATAADLEKVKEAQRRSHETALRQNGAWLSWLGDAWEYGDDPALVLTWDQLPAGLTSQSIRDAARAWLRSDNYVRVVLLPEK